MPSSSTSSPAAWMRPRDRGEGAVEGEAAASKPAARSSEGAGRLRAERGPSGRSGRPSARRCARGAGQSGGDRRVRQEDEEASRNYDLNRAAELKDTQLRAGAALKAEEASTSQRRGTAASWGGRSRGRESPLIVQAGRIRSTPEGGGAARSWLVSSDLHAGVIGQGSRG